MPNDVPRERELFLQVFDLPEPERTAFLERACGPDAVLRQRILELLGAGVEMGRFLGGSEVAAPRPSPPAVSRYLLHECLGEGGFGVVYRADQRDPIRRAVALKVLKPGMDSGRVLARFEAERQALARMNHAGIARVYDAGTTECGRPYVAMELVAGPPITRFCDDHQLTVPARLRLLQTVCNALQHAHQKGIIHRDLKPSNVLVSGTPADPEPKIIDFGVAKAVDPGLEAPDGLTRGFELLGTPAYMSPEQARVTDRDIDTRSDVFSMGILLHELLVGRTPWDQVAGGPVGLAHWRSRAGGETHRRPSARLAGLSDAEQAAIAAHRGTTPTLLLAAVRDDLDWIVLRCLEQDPERRYPSASALAEDLGRHLRREPVMAVRPGLRYRAAKFLSRHRIAVAVAAGAALVLATATTLSLFLAVRARDAENRAAQLLDQERRQRLAIEALRLRADEEAASAEAATRYLAREILSAADPDRFPEEELTLRTVLDRASARMKQSPLRDARAEATIHESLGRSYASLGLWASAEPHYDAAHRLYATLRGPDAPETLRTAIDLAYARHASGDSSGAVPLAESAWHLARERLGEAHPLTLHCGNRLAWIYYALGRRADWHRVAEETFQEMQGNAAVEDADLLGIQYLVARKRGSRQGGTFEVGEQLLLQGVELMRQRQGEWHPITLAAQAYLAGYYYDHWRKVSDAEQLLVETLARQRRVLGDRHEATRITLKNLAQFQLRAGHDAGADWALRRLLQLKPVDPAIIANLADLWDRRPPDAAFSQTMDSWTRAGAPPGVRTADAPALEPREYATAAEAVGPGWWESTFFREGPHDGDWVLDMAGIVRGEVWLNGSALAPPFQSAPARHLMAVGPDGLRALRHGTNVLTLRIHEQRADRPVRVKILQLPPANLDPPAPARTDG
ncbi:MAG: protein kinase [Verrucomicrobiae bacterium]|nr:protein kinase [Verrucomicrobiae bacterium]